MFCYKFYFQREISEMRVLTGVKFCTMVRTVPNFIMLVQNYRGQTPKNILGAKNMQNLARFRTTSNFGGEYLRNGWKYSKSDFHSAYRYSSCVMRKKFGEVLSGDLGDLDVKSCPPKAHFSNISAIRECCALKFLHALENDQVLLAYQPLRTAVPLQVFFQNGVKNWLKCNKLALITLKLKSVARRNFDTWRASMLGC